MSRSFFGVGDYSLDLSNGLSFRLLRALGYSVTEESSGKMSIEVAKKAIAEVWRDSTYKGLSQDDLRYLRWLEEVVDDLDEAGSTLLTWS